MLTAHLIDTAGQGDFLSPEFLECIRRKMDLVIRSLEENPGDVLLWSDVDIIFLGGRAADLGSEIDRSGKDILYQSEGKNTSEVNTGFIVCRSTPETIAFFARIRDELQEQPEKNEQAVANELLSDREYALNWGYLPMDYYARTHGWPPPKSIRIYHANYTIGKDGIGQKIRQFRELTILRKYGTLGFAYLLPAKFIAKFRRKLISDH